MEILKYIKKIIDWFVSSLNSFFVLIGWLVRICIKTDCKNYIKKQYVGKTLDIIVNGPSFAEQKDIVKTDGHHKCMVNFAACSTLFEELKPDFYCVSDPAFFSLYKTDENIKEFIEIINSVNWPMTFFVTYSDYKNVLTKELLITNPLVRIVPFNGCSLPYDFKFKKLAYLLFDKGLASPKGVSVSVPVIMNAISSGFTHINLYGYDQDWIHNVVVDEQNRVCLVDTHFYNKEGERRLWLKNETETFTMSEILKSQYELFESYYFIRDYIKFKKDITIINKSSVSLIDAFERG